MANQSLATSLQPLRYDEPEAFALPSLSGTIGIYTIGTFASLILYGISCHQFYRYGRLHSKDNAYLKALLLRVPGLSDRGEIEHCRTDSNPLALGQQWYVSQSATMSTSPLQCSERINVLKSRSLQAITVKTFQIENFQRFGEQSKGITRASLALAASADYLLAAALIVVLRRGRENHARASWAEIVTMYIINTGLLTGTLQWTAALMSFKFPLDFYWAALTLITMKLRTMILLSVLNSRKTMASRGITVFNNSSYTRNAIARAHRLAVVEQFNVPRDPCEDVPPVISIKVVAETEVHGPHYGSSSVDNDSEAGC
ncbi:hypothetical protein ONZ51_g5961 [Trametes cubensis]|uniref:DUF6534 domain-containing protein n=1 Tax=Trametes cubensis TaxID=1111947 RepID=A0AAD7XAG5_9APHY|nr:hypothetical protein ONZ51_g5961 [Trametes cubensis]